MPYSNFTNTKTKLSQAKSWQLSRTLNVFLQEVESFSFSRDRDYIRYELNLISTKSFNSSSFFCKVVDEHQRFDELHLIYNMSHPAYLKIFSKLYSALDLGDKKCVQSKKGACSCTHRYDSALKLYASSMLQLKTAFLSGVGVYDCEIFEKEHDLQWNLNSGLIWCPELSSNVRINKLIRWL